MFDVVKTSVINVQLFVWNPPQKLLKIMFMQFFFSNTKCYEHIFIFKPIYLDFYL